MKMMKFASFILWDMSDAVKSDEAGWLRAAALNLGFGAVPQRFLLKAGRRPARRMISERQR
jgi:hypothetical protein